MNSMAMRRDYAITIANKTDLYRLDQHSGLAQHLVRTPLADIRALAYSPGDVLYAINKTSFFGPSQLFTVDDVTGNATFISDLPVRASQALDFSPQGVLFGWSRDDGLLTIDPVDGTYTPVNPGGTTGSPFMQSLAFTRDGLLFGTDGNDLYTVDVATSATAYVPMVNFPYGVRGLADLTIPEPSLATILLVVSAAVLPTACRRDVY